VGHFCPSGSGSGSTDLILNPDPKSGSGKHWFYSSPDLDNLAVLVGEPAGRHEDGGGDKYTYSIYSILF
jgi:hypothetical protein